MGGLPKKAFQLHALRQKNKNLLAIDAGALLFKQPHLQTPQREQLTATALGIVKAYNTMGIQAVGIARRDLAAGVDFLQAVQKESSFPWLSANLISQHDRKPLFKEYTVLQVAGLRIGVIGLTGSGPTPPLSGQGDAIIVPWEEALGEVLDRLAGQNDFILLLSNLPLTENRKIAAQYPQINIIVQSGTSTGNMMPTRVYDTLITQAEHQGKQVGLMTIFWNPLSKKWGEPTAKLLLDKRHAYDRLTWQISKYRKKGVPEEVYKDRPEIITAYRNMVAQQKKNEQEIDRLTRQLAEEEATGNVASTYTNKFIAMKINLPDDPAVLEIVNATTQEVNRIGKKDVGARQREANRQDLAMFAGSKRCMECHAHQGEIWQRTRHARAYDTLVKKGQQFNLKCIPCHVTGRTGSGQGPTANLQENLVNVGCESCHGAGRDHVASQGGVKLTNPTQETCLQCHTDEHDDDFQFGRDSENLGCDK